MVTPFDLDGSVNFDAAREVAQFLCENGSDGLVVAGSTGEGPALSDQEKLDLFACVAESVTKPVLAGSTFANTESSVALTSQVARTGVAGVLATTPAYSRPSQRGIALHLAAVANATTLPVMLYDIPSRTGRKIAGHTTIDLARAHANVVAVKDASADLATAAHVKQELGDSIDLYSGDDALVLEFLAIGGCGVVSVAAHWAGLEFSAMVGAALEGDRDRAAAMNERLRESCEFESTESYPNPMPSKAAMRYLGLGVGDCRLPHAPTDPALDARAAEVVSALQATRG